MREQPAKRPSDAGAVAGATASKVVRLTSAPAVTAPAKQIVKLPATAPVLSAKGVDNSAEAQLDRTQRFVTSGTVSLKGAGGPPLNAFAPKTQLGLGGAKAGAIRGSSQALERPYLRLHFAPDPSTIRPPAVLERALALVKQKWVQQQDFRHASEQLMAIQQDCKLQGVENKVRTLLPYVSPEQTRSHTSCHTSP